jgi:hypothetical protein
MHSKQTGMLMKKSICYLAIILINVIYGCDIVDHDGSFENNPQVEILKDEVYIPAEPGSSIINLSSLIHTNQTVKFVINDLPRYGTIDESKIGTGMVEYNTPFVSSK